MTYVLVDTLASKEQGQMMWFKQMIGIGTAMSTLNRAEAREYLSRDAAINSPALRHTLTFYEVVEED